MEDELKMEKEEVSLKKEFLPTLTEEDTCDCAAFYSLVLMYLEIKQSESTKSEGYFDNYKFEVNGAYVLIIP